VNERSIISPLYNIECPAVEGSVTVIISDSKIIQTQVVLINYGPDHVMYQYAKCYPILLTHGEMPLKMMELVAVVKQGEMYQHRIHGDIFRKVNNLEYIEWKYVESTHRSSK
jgi:hypothetical protein